MDKLDSLKSSEKMDTNIEKILKSFEERFSTLETNMESIILMNEDISKKLQSSSQNEVQQNAFNKMIMDKISRFENEDISKNTEEPKLNDINKGSENSNVHEKIAQASEIGKSTIIKENDIVKIEKPEDTGYIILKFNDVSNMNMLERILKRNKDPYHSLISQDNGEEVKLFDIQWFKRNLSVLTGKCSEIIMNNIETLEIEEDTIFSNDTILTGIPETNLNFKDNSSLIIEGNGTFNNINIMNCQNDAKSLIEINEASKFEFNNGFIENNSENESLFHVGEHASLILNQTLFNNNIQLKEHHKSCIYTESKANVHINKCEFLNHTSKEHPYSASLIFVNGNLTINSSKFENNKTGLKIWTCIKCANGNLDFDDVKIKNCSFTSFENCHEINVKNSVFMNNCAIGSNGGSLYIKNCENINIENCTFKNNETDIHGGALYLNKCFGNIFIKSCLFKENCAWHDKNGGGGGAIYTYESKVTLEDNIFQKNSTEGSGGAIFAFKSIIPYSNCTFESNRAKEAGGATCSIKGHLMGQRSNRFINNTAKKDNDVSKN